MVCKVWPQNSPWRGFDWAGELSGPPAGWPGPQLLCLPLVAAVKGTQVPSGFAVMTSGACLGLGLMTQVLLLSPPFPFMRLMANSPQAALCGRHDLGQHQPASLLPPFHTTCSLLGCHLTTSLEKPRCLGVRAISISLRAGPPLKGEILGLLPQVLAQP